MGKDHKDISVWGDELVLNCPQQIRSNRTIKCQIALNPFVTANRRCTAVAQFSLDGGKFFGSVRPVFRLDASSTEKLHNAESVVEQVMSLIPFSQPVSSPG